MSIVKFELPKVSTDIDIETFEEDGKTYEKGTYPNGDVEYTIKNVRHREYGPAIEANDGSKYWYLDGKLHREGAPAIEYANGDKCWYVDGELHREDGPAVEKDGVKYWYYKGKLHREDGPAIENSNGNNYWFLYGIPSSEPKVL